MNANTATMPKSPCLQAALYRILSQAGADGADVDLAGNEGNAIAHLHGQRFRIRLGKVARNDAGALDCRVDHRG